MSADQDKSNLRETARARRIKAHNQDAEGAAQSLATHVLALLEDKPPTIIAGYRAIGSEIDVGPLMGSLVGLGWHVALPVVVENAAPLIFRSWTPGDELVEGPLKTVQPGAQCAQVVPDVIITPLLAFDEQGYRLGQGGGFYDRTLATLSVLSIGVAFAAQRVELVPRDWFDQRLDFIVTEQGKI
ncbi:MAG: 5-formyltetrahydrofolate cyclo-ligase [Rhodospirillaceae bacterium]|nr:5-formyltetrahydrofolate cyclo-ligase [Rhodospirillaceae bacterium]